MASVPFLSRPIKPLPLLSIPPSPGKVTFVKCATNFDNASSSTEQDERFEVEKRRKSEILRERRSPSSLEKPEPPNFEIGWKRTKEIPLTKPKGFVIADFLEKLEGLMGREFGSTELLAKAGEIVVMRAREEAEVLREEGEVEERLITELFRVLKLMEMDLEMVKAAVKEETLSKRLETARARCRPSSLKLVLQEDDTRGFEMHANAMGCIYVISDGSVHTLREILSLVVGGNNLESSLSPSSQSSCNGNSLESTPDSTLDLSWFTTDLLLNAKKKCPVKESRNGSSCKLRAAASIC